MKELTLHQLIYEKLDFDLLPQVLIVLICENLITTFLQVQDLLASGNTITLYKIFMVSKSLPLAAWSFPKLIIRAFYPLKIYRDQSKRRRQTKKENELKKKELSKQICSDSPVLMNL